MSSAEYSFVLTDPTGGSAWRKDVTDLVISADVLRQESAAGRVIVQLAPRLEAWRLGRDTRLFVYEQFPWSGKRLYLEQGYQLRKYRRTLDQWTLSGKDYNGLLARRVIAYKAGTTNASTTAAIDDALKDLVDTNLGAGATDTTRAIDDLTIAADLTAAPTTSKAYSYNKLHDTMIKLAQDAAEQGTYVAFDLTALDEQRRHFATYTGQRGKDRRETSSQPFVFSVERGNVENVVLEINYEEEVTRGYAGAQGTNSDRNVQPSTDSARADASPDGLMEDYRDATQIKQNDTTGATNAAAALVRAGRPFVLITADYIETPDSVAGRDFDFGDYVTLKAFDYVLDVRLSTFHTVIGRASGGAFEARTRIAFRVEGEIQ